MAHYALLNHNNVVTEVVTGKDEDSVVYNIELVYQDMFKQTCKRTSYNTIGGIHKNGGVPFRKNYAGVGYTYDYSRDAFIPPKPFDSWTLNETSCLWEPPVAYPTDGQTYEWNEELEIWDLITNG
jgi:hypothetical protein